MDWENRHPSCLEPNKEKAKLEGKEGKRRSTEGGRQGKYSIVLFECLQDRENDLIPGIKILSPPAQALPGKLEERSKGKKAQRRKVKGPFSLGDDYLFNFKKGEK